MQAAVYVFQERKIAQKPADNRSIRTDRANRTQHRGPSPGPSVPLLPAGEALSLWRAARGPPTAPAGWEQRPAGEACTLNEPHRPSRFFPFFQGCAPQVTRDWQTLRRHGIEIWQAGLDAVRSDRLVESTVRVDGEFLWIGDEPIDLATIGRIVIVGAGKAGAGMAAGLERALGPQILADKQVTGWVNVPADCAGRWSASGSIRARPAGVNEPTAEGVRGAEEILRIVGEPCAPTTCASC